MRKSAVVGSLILCLAAGGVAAEDNATWESGFDLAKPLDTARGLFLQVDMRAAGAKVRQASKDLRASARDAAAGVRKSLNDTADELEVLGKRIEERNVHRVEELDRSFARAYHALAEQHFLRGREHWIARDPQPAGHRLSAAADNLERAVTATGKGINMATGEVIRESRVVSGKLIQGAGYATDEVGQTFEAFGKQVETLGKNVAPVASRSKSDVRSE